MGDHKTLRDMGRANIPARTIAIFLLAGLGTAMLLRFGEDDRGIAWTTNHVSYLQTHLAALANQMQIYHAQYNTYPDNDTGLLALDEYHTTYRVPTVRDEYFPESLHTFYEPYSFYAPYLATRMYKGPSLLETLEWGVDAFKQAHGRLPESWTELKDWPSLFIEGYPLDESDGSPYHLDVAVGPDYKAFVKSPAGLLSPGLVPYIYENRRGLDADRFGMSPVGDGDAGASWVRVDQGIYIWSPEAQYYAEQADAAQWEYDKPRYVGAVLLLVAFWITIRSFHAGMHARVAGGISMLVGLVVGFGGGQLGRATCYVMSSPFSRRPPEMVDRQRQLLKQYHDRGIINTDTYNRATRVLENPPDGKPPTDEEP